MLYSMINKMVEVNVALSDAYVSGGSVPKIYRGILLEEDDKNIKLKITHKKKETIIVINLKFVISVLAI